MFETTISNKQDITTNNVNSILERAVGNCSIRSSEIS